MKKAALLLVAISTLTASVAFAQEVVGWRSDWTGKYDAQNPPTTWSKDSNIVWKTELPDRSNSTPVIVGDRIFFNAEPTSLVCVSKTDGKILWTATNNFFDILTPEEIEKAKEMQKQAEAVRAEIKPLDDERRQLESVLRRIRDTRKKIDDVQKELAEIQNAQKLAAKIDSLKKKSDDLAKKLAENPNDGRVKKESEQVVKQLAQLQDEQSRKGLVERLQGDLDKAQKQLAADEPTEKETKAKADDLKKQADTLRREKLEPLTVYDMPPTHGTNGYSSCTPVSDGKYVYTLLGNGMVGCYDLSGNRKWLKRIEKPRHGWGHSASPVLVGDKLIVQILQTYALDKETGEKIWEAKGVPTRWGTPVATRIGDVDVVITPNGEVIRVEDGEVIGRGFGKLEYATPIVSDGVVYFVERGGRADKLPEEPADRIRPEVLYSLGNIEGDRYYASAVLHEGLLYGINQRSHLTVLDAATGEKVYEKKIELGAAVYPSICLAGNFIYISSDNGKTVVLEASREYRELARNELGEQFRSTPVFDGNRMYIRGMKNLYCISK